MENNEPAENNAEKTKRRLDNPIWRLTSILAIVGAIGVFLYGIIGGYRIFSVMTVIFFLMLWFVPQLWNWIEFVFRKRPSSRWGRFVLNLAIAILMASMFEDLTEILGRFLRFIFRILTSL